MNSTLKLLSIRKSTRQNKKWVARFSDGTETHFGDNRYSDFTMHKNKLRKQAYIHRHQKNENWNDPTTAGALSRYILWNLPTIEASIRDYKKRFSL